MKFFPCFNWLFKTWKVLILHIFTMTWKIDLPPHLTNDFALASWPMLTTILGRLLRLWNVGIILYMCANFNLREENEDLDRPLNKCPPPPPLSVKLLMKNTIQLISRNFYTPGRTMLARLQVIILLVLISQKKKYRSRFRMLLIF